MPVLPVLFRSQELDVMTCLHMQAGWSHQALVLSDVLRLFIEVIVDHILILRGGGHGGDAAVSEKNHLFTL